MPANSRWDLIRGLKGYITLFQYKYVISTTNLQAFSIDGSEGFIRNLNLFNSLKLIRHSPNISSVITVQQEIS